MRLETTSPTPGTRGGATRQAEPPPKRLAAPIAPGTFTRTGDDRVVRSKQGRVTRPGHRGRRRVRDHVARRIAVRTSAQSGRGVLGRRGGAYRQEHRYRRGSCPGDRTEGLRLAAWPGGRGRCASTDFPAETHHHALTQCLTGFSKNSSTAIPPPPTRSVRSGLKASANAAMPGSVSATRPLLTSMAVTVLPAFTT
jgi:hypothetical protein